MADCVDAVVEAMEDTPTQALFDRAPADARGQQLRPGHDSVLARGQAGDRRVGRWMQISMGVMDLCCHPRSIPRPS